MPAKVRLFESRRKRASFASRVARSILWELHGSPEGVPPYALAKLLIENGPYSEDRKVKSVLSNVKNVLRSMRAKRAVRVSGSLPGRKGGAGQDVYALTDYGRLLAALFPPDGKKVDRQSLREHLRGFIRQERDASANPFASFELDVMAAGLESEGAGELEGFFQLALESFDRDELAAPSADWTRSLRSMWSTYHSYPIQPAYARAVLGALEKLPEAERHTVSRMLKLVLETSYPLGMDVDESFVEAMTDPDVSAVHVPARCPQCREARVIRRTVNQLYRDALQRVRYKCDVCSHRLEGARWTPWYMAAEKEVWSGWTI